MKKVMFSLAAIVVLMLAAGCSKEHKCKCVTTDVPDDGWLKVFVVDGSISCDDIKEMAFEEHVSGNGQNTLRRVEQHKVDCRDYEE